MIQSGGLGRVDYRIRPQNSGWWNRVGNFWEAFVQHTKPLRALVYCHEHTRNMEDLVWSVEPSTEGNREQLVGIGGVRENGSRYDKTVPRQSEQDSW